MESDRGKDRPPIGRLPSVPPVPSHSEAKHNLEISGWKQEDEEGRGGETIAMMIKPQTIQALPLTKGK